MKQITLNVALYEELSKEAQSVVIDKYLALKWFDLSHHETSEYNNSLNVFNSIFGVYGHIESVGDEAKLILVQCINHAAKLQAKANPYYADSFEEKYGSDIEKFEDAVAVCKNCLLTGVCVDFYLLEPIIEFLEGKQHQSLTFKQLIALCRSHGRKELAKAIRYFQTRKHVHERLLAMCEDYFFEDGTQVPEGLMA